MVNAYEATAPADLYTEALEISLVCIEQRNTKLDHIQPLKIREMYCLYSEKECNADECHGNGTPMFFFNSFTSNERSATSSFKEAFSPFHYCPGRFCCLQHVGTYWIIFLRFLKFLNIMDLSSENILYLNVLDQPKRVIIEG